MRGDPPTCTPLTARLDIPSSSLSLSESTLDSASADSPSPKQPGDQNKVSKNFDHRSAHKRMCNKTTAELSALRRSALSVCFQTPDNVPLFCLPGHFIYYRHTRRDVCGEERRENQHNRINNIDRFRRCTA